MDPSQAPKIETIELEKIMVQVVQEFDQLFFKNTKAEVQDTVRGMMIRLRHEIYGQHDYQQYTVDVDVPKTWWQHFKQDHMPTWYKMRFPVRYKLVSRTVSFDHKKLFPESEINYPSHLGPVVCHTTPQDPNVHK